MSAQRTEALLVTIDQLRAQLDAATKERDRWKDARGESEACIVAIGQAAGPRNEKHDIIEHVATLKADLDAARKALDLLRPWFPDPCPLCKSAWRTSDGMSRWLRHADNCYFAILKGGQS